MPRKYSKASQRAVKRTMHERKEGTLRSGRSGKKVTSRKQAIAIGLSEAREAGAKVPSPRKKTGGRKASGRKAASGKKSSGKNTGKKTSSRSTSGKKGTSRTRSRR